MGRRSGQAAVGLWGAHGTGPGDRARGGSCGEIHLRLCCPRIESRRHIRRRKRVCCTALFFSSSCHTTAPSLMVRKSKRHQVQSRTACGQSTVRSKSAQESQSLRWRLRQLRAAWDTPLRPESGNAESRLGHPTAVSSSPVSAGCAPLSPPRPRSSRCPRTCRRPRHWRALPRHRR